MTQGNRRTWLLLGALVGVFALAFAGLAGAKLKTKTFSSGTISEEFGSDPSTVVQDIGINKKKFKRAKVKDVDVGVRIDHTYDGDVDISLTSPSGRTVTLSSGNGEAGDDYGSGDSSCSGTKTVFNDEAETLISDGVAPFARQFKPEGRLSTLDGAKVKGIWRLTVDDTFGIVDDGVLRCVDLKVKYKKKKKH